MGLLESSGLRCFSAAARDTDQLTCVGEVKRGPEKEQANAEKGGSGYP